jgi:hypothetical protein
VARKSKSVLPKSESIYRPHCPPSPAIKPEAHTDSVVNEVTSTTKTLIPQSPPPRPFRSAILSSDHRNSRLSRSSTATGLSSPASRNYIPPSPTACAAFKRALHAPWKYGFCQLIDRPSPDTSRLPAVVPQMTLLCSGHLLPKLHTTGGVASPLSFPLSPPTIRRTRSGSSLSHHSNNETSRFLSPPPKARAVIPASCCSAL